MQERAFNALARAVIAANATRDRCFATRAQFWIDPEDDGHCITLRTPYDKRAKRFVDLSRCRTSCW